MKAALLSAIAIGTQLARAKDQFEGVLRRKFAICEFHAIEDLSKDEPEINGVLLLNDGLDIEYK